jgi:hypothetical protein
VDAPADDQRNLLRLDAEFPEAGLHRLQHHGKVEARIGDLLGFGRAEVPPRVARMLDHDRIGQAVFAHPFLHHDLHAAGVGQDRDQRNAGMACRHVRQVEGQSRAHHDRVGAAFAGLAHISSVLAHRLHHVHRDRAASLGQHQRLSYFAVQRDQVDAIDGRLVAGDHRLRQQIGMVVAQVDARHGADRAHARHAPGEPVRGDAHAHSALDNGQQFASLEAPSGQ